MPRIAVRDLRNDTAGVLRRVQAGEEVVVTVRGEPVAQIIALTPQTRRWIPRRDVLDLLRSTQADPGLRDELAVLSGGPADLDPVV
jgi:prevent-host-death family protein